MNDRDILDRVTIEPMGDRDLEQVMLIENRSFLHPWKLEGFQSELEREPAVSLVLRDGLQVCGYLIFWRIPPEFHILNIAVRPDLRQLGLGRLLLEYLTELALKTGITDIFLEVRPSNVAAQALYKGIGFQFTGVRKNYYSREKEDAWLMTLKLDPK